MTAEIDPVIIALHMLRNPINPFLPGVSAVLEDQHILFLIQGAVAKNLSEFYFTSLIKA